jgi:APA family basic amino acid/polyamine antiporter
MTNKELSKRPKHLLSSGFTLAVTIGGIIGLGILRTPGEVATLTSNPLFFVSLWLLGGMFILLSITVAGELVGMTPRSGGTYSMVRRAYGPFPGFVIGWVDWLSYVADIGLKSVVVTEFTILLIPSMGQWQTPLAIVVTTIFAALQLRSIILSARIQEIAAATMAIIVIGFTLALVFSRPVAGTAQSLIHSDPKAIGGWSIVIAALIYSYDGWISAAYFSGEIQGGGRAIVKAAIKGVAIVVLLYVTLMAALSWKVPLENLAGNDLALSKARELVITPVASTIVLIAAIIMTLANQNLLYMSTPRILQALAVDGLAFKRAGQISKGGNPVIAVLITWGLSVVLIILGGFDFLLYLSVFFYLFIYVILIGGVIVLRLRQPEAERPYRAWGHPWSTYLCLMIWIALAIFQVISQMETAAYAAIMILIAWPLYRFILRSPDLRKSEKKGKSDE